MENNNTTPQHIKLFLYNNKKYKYQPVGALLQLPDGTVGFSYMETYDGPAVDPVNLDYQGKQKRSFALSRSGSLKGAFFSDLLPGAYGEKILRAHYPEWYKLTDFEKLHALGTRDIGPWRCMAERNVGERPVIGKEHLHVVESKVRAFHVNELEDLLSELSDSEYALTIHKTERPSIDYQEFSGERYICKIGLPGDEVDFVSTEQASMTLARLGGAIVPETIEAKLPSSGRRVFLSERTDVLTPGRGAPTNVVARSFKHHKISFEALIKTEAPTYQDMMRIVDRCCVNPDQDIKKLYSTMLIMTGMNATELAPRDFCLILKEDGYQLGPISGIRPSLETNMPFSIRPDQNFSSAINARLDREFIRSTAMSFGLSKDDASALAIDVTEQIANWESHFLDSGVKTYDIARFKAAGCFQDTNASRLLADLKGQDVYDGHSNELTPSF